MSDKKLRIGFIPLCDATSLLIAVDKGFAAAEGLDIELVREVSWANVRDKLNIGIFDSAHLIAPVAIASSLGLGHVKVPIVAAFGLGVNGNAITVSPALHAAITANAEGDTTDPMMTAKALAKALVASGTDGIVATGSQQDERALELAPNDPAVIAVVEELLPLSETRAAAAVVLEQLISQLPVSAERAESVVTAEKQADAVLRDVRAALETVIVTPFDREDIQSLANSLDDVLDEMRAAADTALQHRISAPLAGVSDLLAAAPPQPNILFIIADDMVRLKERIIRLKDPNCHAEYPPSHTRRLITNVRILEQSSSSVSVTANAE